MADAAIGTNGCKDTTTPFTPFHFGPGLLIKAAIPRRFGFIAFAATNVLVDVETLVHMMRQEWPVHRMLHSYIGSTATGLITGLLTVATFRVIAKWVWRGNRATDDPLLAEVVRRSDWTAIVGGLVGGASHTLLDSIMHSDVQPFWPFSRENQFFGTLSVPALHLGCVVAACVGIGILLINRPVREIDRD